MSRREFDLVAPDARLVWLVPGIAAFAILVGIGVLATQEPHALVTIPIALVSITVLALLLRRRRVEIDDAGMLTISAGFNTHRVAAADLDLDSARVVDLRERSEWKPLIKIFGTRLPGLAMGHFRLRDRSAAFVLLTDRSRVLVLPEKSGKKLLLSLQQPQGLLDALRKR
jgi:hypothetical protein